MCEPKGYYCPNPDCGNMAFEPGSCSACGADLEEEEMISVDESLEGFPCSAGFAPRDKSVSHRVNELLAELPPGRECSKCGGMMVHERLHGYRCWRGCQ